GPHMDRTRAQLATAHGSFLDQEVGFRVVVPAAGGSSPVAHPSKGPAKRAVSRFRSRRFGPTGQTRGKSCFPSGDYSASLRLSEPWHDRSGQTAQEAS